MNDTDFDDINAEWVTVSRADLMALLEAWIATSSPDDGPGLAVMRLATACAK